MACLYRSVSGLYLPSILLSYKCTNKRGKREAIETTGQIAENGLLKEAVLAAEVHTVKMYLQFEDINLPSHY